MAARPKPVSLALQGGGAHGAFTWGVLDAILEDGRLDPQAITATSAGAMNAVIFAHARHAGGPEAAREALARFWEDVSRAGRAFQPPGALLWGPFAKAMQGTWLNWLDAWSRLTSPYDVNPLNINPLREILSAHVDFPGLAECGETKLFLTATCVRTGRAHVFRNADITADAVLASACLPFLFQAVEIGDDAYWDGGFTGNPSLWPLFYEPAPRDLLIVHINPMLRDETPKTAAEILNRVNEITFNTSLLAELRAIAYAKRLIGQRLLAESERQRLRDVLVHSIRADDALSRYSAETKHDTSRAFLHALRDAGREAAQGWLAKHFDAVGERSTVDVHAEFLAEPARR
ncbi:MAG: patatin-like phospholipase family protein [Maricaulaceae bacterium]|nr:patatin-like phospholipase family protein [Maricaulaceae bacterium]